MLIVSQFSRTRVERSMKVMDKIAVRYWANSLKGQILRNASIYGFRNDIQVHTSLIFDKRLLTWQGQVEIWTKVVRLQEE